MDVQQLVTGAAVVAAGVVGFLIGDYRGDLRLQDERLQAAVLRADQGRQAYEKIVAAQDALASARADAIDLRADAERVRRAAEDRVRRAEAAAAGADGAADSGCEKLLGRCAGLLARGGELAQGVAAKHDALVKAVSP
ncbi:hypothetical protein [Sutterella wadsworthensis]|uniref:hypothetical protein n=1 Tax=Sutterella wadsworthensis TaxID=40545 RepID=UPI003AEFF4D2